MKFYRTEWGLYFCSIVLIFISVCFTFYHVYYEHSHQKIDLTVLQTLIEWFDLIFIMNVIFYVVVHTPQIAPPLYTEGNFDEYGNGIFLFFSFLSRLEDIFIGFKTSWLFASRIFGYLGMTLFILNDYILHCGFFVAWSTIAVQIDDSLESLWGSYLITIKEARLVAVCIPKRNEVHIIQRSNVDLIMVEQFWIPMYVVRNRIDLPNWMLASVSRQAAAPG